MILDRVSKKGVIRKLIEYLSVHRSYLNDSMQHTFRIMRQNKTFVSRITSLIVMDQLTENLNRFVNAQPMQSRSNKDLRKSSVVQRSTVGERDVDVRF
jgi:hypothetical protein